MTANDIVKQNEKGIMGLLLKIGIYLMLTVFLPITLLGCLYLTIKEKWFNDD